MKKLSIAKWFVLIGISSFLFTGCKKEKDSDSNVISDNSGLTITLDWSLNDNSTALTGADLDALLITGDVDNEDEAGQSILIDESENETSFESMELSASESDGDYTAVIYFFDVTKPGKATFRFTGLAGNGSYSVTEIPFTEDDIDKFKFSVKITKVGNRYTISRK